MSGLIPLGDPNATACEGDVCAVPGLDAASADVSVPEQAR